MARVIDYDVRVLEPAEYRRAHTLFRAALHFGPASDEDWLVVRSSFLPGRAWAAFHDGAMVGVAQSYESRLTVPGGGSVPMAMVSRVGVRADHTRRGVLTGLMRAQLGRLAEPVATLRASEGPIYGRFGYGVATRSRSVLVDRRRAVAHPDAPVGGQIRLVDVDELDTVLPAVYDRISARRPGSVARPAHWWLNLRMQAKESGNPVVAVHRGADGDDGYVVYGVRYPDFVTTPTAGSVLNVLDLHTGSAEAWSGLWRFLFGVDLVDEINTWQRPLDEPVEMLLHDPRAARTTRLSDETWLRLVDVPTALAARTFYGEGSVVFEVRDAVLPANAGRYRVDGRGVSRTEERPQLVLDVSALGALYLGDVRCSALAEAGRLTVLDAEALPVADRLFAAEQTPWCGTYF